MKEIANIYDKFEERLLVISIVFNVILVFIQVIMRSVFNYSLSWSEELSRYIFIWQTWLGTSTALKYDEHINVGLIFSFIKNVRISNLIKIFADTIWLLFSGFLVYNGTQLLQSMMQRNALSSGMRIPLVWVYAVLPICSVIVCIRLVFRLINKFKNIDVDTSKSDIMDNSEIVKIDSQEAK